MGVESAATGRASENRIGACIHGRACRGRQDAAPVWKGIFMLIQLAQGLGSLNARMGAGEGLGRTDDGRVGHDLKLEPAAHEV